MAAQPDTQQRQLAYQLEQLREYGHCVIDAVIPPSEVGAVEAAVLAATSAARNPTAPEAIGHVPGLITHDQTLAPYLADERVMALVTAVLGPYTRISFTTGQTNYAGCQRQEWHADWPFNQSGAAHVPAPYRDGVMHLTTLWMLSPMTEETGTILLPGTHRTATNPSVPGAAGSFGPLDARPGETRAVGSAGSVLVLDSRLWHCVPPNSASSPRVAVAVRYAPWWFDTSVVMPSSPARVRIVDSVGSIDTAGIPLGNPAQPAVPPSVWKALPPAVRPLYAHWVRGAERADLEDSVDHWTVTPAGGVQEPAAAPAAAAAETAALLERLEDSGYCVVPAPETTGAFSAGSGLMGGLLSAALGANYRATLRRQYSAAEIPSVARCEWPHDHAASPIVADAAAKLLLHLTAHWAAAGTSERQVSCQVLVGSQRSWSEASRMSADEWETVPLQPGEALILDSRLLRRWGRPRDSRSDLVLEEAGFAPWWVDSAVLGSSSAPARTRLAQQGVTQLPEPARLLPQVAGDNDGGGGGGGIGEDLTGHWIVEEEPLPGAEDLIVARGSEAKL